MKKINFILSVAFSTDYFIADQCGNGDFSSTEDKEQFRSFLRSDECDCFVCGRKTAEEFKSRLTYKPLFIFTHQKKENRDNYTYVYSLQELFQCMQRQKLYNCALLGGASIYEYFLKKKTVSSIRLTQEDIIFEKGTFLNLEKYLEDFKLTEVKKIGSHTRLSLFSIKQKE